MGSYIATGLMVLCCIAVAFVYGAAAYDTFRSRREDEPGPSSLTVCIALAPLGWLFLAGLGWLFS